ncbi:5'-methylthioadenosine/adenosylhomocysteine nucleosidase [Cytophaga aurantiaca]|uniref:5'-methylthioadenosine/adenosylhomocysteine nucleosidase n=1 Tax=Cytophaga aurantiaca TaxID=29530 RepID=UPI0003691EC5|nr:5'-methylthioadenosine/adenosylhomocysteine nucleosidase [Cytophaga aurantiaca]
MEKEQITGILVPMQQEIELILHHMHVENIVETGSRKFYVGTIQGKKSVVSLSRIGKVASSVTAAVMIERFGVDRIIVTGVAGGLTDEVKIGDIVVATSSVQHDMDCRPIFPQFEIPLLDVTTFNCDTALVEDAFKSCSTFIKEELYDFVSKEELEALHIQQPTVHKGLLVSGDQFIGTMPQYEKIRAELPDAIFVEMEGAAVAQVCYEYKVPLVVVRSISDKANAIAHIDFNRYIENVAKYYTWGLIEGMMK